MLKKLFHITQVRNETKQIADTTYLILSFPTGVLQEFIEQVIKSETGVDVEHRMIYTFDSQNNAIGIEFVDDQFIDEEVEQLQPYSFNEAFLNTTWFLEHLMQQVDIPYTNRNQLEASVDPYYTRITNIYIPQS